MEPCLVGVGVCVVVVRGVSEVAFVVASVGALSRLLRFLLCGVMLWFAWWCDGGGMSSLRTVMVQPNGSSLKNDFFFAVTAYIYKI